eukprot:TRINITY_DN3097_c0_g1_i1.p1 TRINITY_DN3097_c0_g1~~TRINITY_DN3097_c0_g1_i1.p1  ORF type:complete len:321 (+),score=34.63 TRINITY_DN3097_c0_g1_i1:142-1104(+)
MVWWLVYAALALLALRLFVIFFLRSKRKPSAQARKALIVLGSGGHSTEMLQLLASVNRDQLSPRCYLLANTDAGSISLAKEFEGDRSDYSFVRIQRSREVGEKTLSSVRNTLSATKQAFGHIWRIWPDIIICNGPGTCVPVCAVALLYRLLWIKDISIIYVESFARVTELSRSGKLLYPFVDRFFVMWPDLAKQRLFNIFRRRVEVVTLLPRAVFDRGDVIRSPSTGKRVFVTVGSTKFDELIRCIDTPETQRALEVINCSSLSVQFGNGSYQPTFSSGPQESIINCFAFRYKPSLEDEVANADVVICHAGMWSCKRLHR